MFTTSNKWLIRGLLFTVFIVVVFILLTLPQQNSQNPDLTTPTQKFPYLVYFCKQQSGSKVSVEGVQASQYPEEVTKKEIMLDSAIHQLLDGPTDEQQMLGFYSEIPAQTKLLNIKTSPKEIRINLSQDFNTGGGSNSVLNRFEQLRKTVVSFNFDRPVYLDLDGDPVEVLGGEGLEIEDPINDGKDAA